MNYCFRLMPRFAHKLKPYIKTVSMTISENDRIADFYALTTLNSIRQGTIKLPWFMYEVLDGTFSNYVHTRVFEYTTINTYPVEEETNVLKNKS